MIEPENDIIKFVSLEGLFVLLNQTIEILELSFKNYLNQFIVRIGIAEI